MWEIAWRGLVVVLLLLVLNNQSIHDGDMQAALWALQPCTPAAGEPSTGGAGTDDGEPATAAKPLLRL